MDLDNICLPPLNVINSRFYLDRRGNMHKDKVILDVDEFRCDSVCLDNAIEVLDKVRTFEGKIDRQNFALLNDWNGKRFVARADGSKMGKFLGDTYFGWVDEGLVTLSFEKERKKKEGMLTLKIEELKSSKKRWEENLSVKQNLTTGAATRFILTRHLIFLFQTRVDGKTFSPRWKYFIRQLLRIYSFQADLLFPLNFCALFEKRKKQKISLPGRIEPTITPARCNLGRHSEPHHHPLTSGWLLIFIIFNKRKI